ncbi:MAG: LPXTG cell wall anchor domain-containing protein [Allosphingosinicella sp.]
MLPIRRRLRAAALILYGLASAGTAALAQDTNTIGPPQLKGFTLPGQRTTPPATPPPVATPPVTTTSPRTAPATAPSTAPVVVRERPAAPAAERREVPPPRREAPATTAPAPVAAPAQTVPAAPVETAPAPPTPAAKPSPAPAEEPGNGWLWPVLGLGGLLLLGAAFLLIRRRRRETEAVQSRAAAREDLGGALLPGAAPEPEPEPETPRPWLDLDIAPDRAAATDAEAVVHYSLTLTNNGEAEAGNIRIDPRLFNAGAEGDIMAFFQGPIHEQSGSPHIRLAPGASLRLMGEVAMPKAELREIEIQGRRIFVPMVAINVAYDWAGGSGRTSKSWLVGREAETPSAKMGPFRLDLGPRIYRSVGRREGRLVRV